MTTLQELQKQRDLLRRKRQTELESKRDMLRIQREREELKREIRDLKNPRTSAFKRNLGRGIRTGGRATLRFLDRITEPTPAQRMAHLRKTRPKPVKRRTVKRRTVKRRRR